MQSDDNNLFSNEEMEALMGVFLEQATQIIETANQSLLAIEQDRDDADAFSQLQRALHTLKGDANSVGFTEIGALSHRLEDLLALFSELSSEAAAELLDLMLYGIDTLGELLQQKRESLHTPVDIRSALERIDRFIRARVKGKKPGQKLPVTEITLTEYQLLQLQSAFSEGWRALQIEARFDEDCTMRAAGALILMRQLQQTGEVVAVFPSIDDDEALETSTNITVVMITERPETTHAAALVAGVTTHASAVPLVLEGGQVRPAAEKDRFLDNRVLESAPLEIAPAASEGEFAERRMGERRGGGVRGLTEILRVDSAKVDMLMDLVGELVISRSMLSQIFSQLKREFPKHAQVVRLGDTDSYLGRVIGELQKCVIQVRMVSLDQVFNRFFRVVRDLAHDGNKLVNLEVVGEETELDKRVVDIIYEPLLHLVRNAVDHGIEPEELRVAQGKPPRGRVSLRAYHQGDQVIIEIEDDGRGIDIEKLKVKAVEKGLRSAEDIKNLHSQDVLDLIFLSGLSTADRVTEVSGRGIGMDVVKSVVESLKGSIEIWSEAGRGTRFTLRLPLTLAIIKSMLFLVGERVFAIPLSTALEITKVSSNEVRQIGRHKVYYLRETLTPLLELDTLLLRELPEERNPNPFVLTVGLGERRIGLAVDRVIGEREIVVKAVDKEWVKTDLVTGASILGDGRIVLILDISALMRRAVMVARSAGGE